MELKKRIVSALMFACLMLVFLSGCGSGNESDSVPADHPAESKQITNDPVTLKFYTNIPKEQYERILAEPIQAKFPHVSFELINVKASHVANQVAAGQIPDLMYYPSGNIHRFKEIELLEDLSPYVKQLNFDMSKLHPTVEHFITTFTEDGQILAMPGNMQHSALLYNIDIFNNFGVEFPVDHMNWEEAQDLARKVARVDNGIKYRGIDFYQDSFLLFNQLGAPFVDPQTNKALVNTDTWKLWFSTIGQLYKTLGNEITPEEASKIREAFTKDRTLAMYGDFDLPAAEVEINWDLVTMPTFKEAPNMGTSLTFYAYSMSPTNPHKELTFEIIKYMLSEEIQIKNTREGRLTTLNDESIKSQFYKDEPHMEGKNLKAYYSLDIPKTAPPTPYDLHVFPIVFSKFREVIFDQKDINTALAEAQEASDLKLQELTNQ